MRYGGRGESGIQKKYPHDGEFRVHFIIMKNLSVKEACEMAAREEGSVIVDVREEGETEGTKIPGALSLPLTRFIKEYTSLEGKKKLFFICASGGRSLMAAEYMESKGHVGVYNILGGALAWEKSGLPFNK